MASDGPLIPLLRLSWRANTDCSRRQGFGRGSNKSSNNTAAAASSAGNTASNTPSGSINSNAAANNNNNNSSPGGHNNSSNTHSGNNGGSSLQRTVDGAGFSPGFPHGQAAMPAPPSAMDQPPAQPDQRDSIKYFFQEKYASLNVKGNFLTLCACPKNVELGEWLAHQGQLFPPVSSAKSTHARYPRESPRLTHICLQLSNRTVCSMACCRSYRRSTVSPGTRSVTR